MKSLDKNWFAEGIIDFEYKKYVLLDYIQSVRKCFLQNKLYPAFSDLISNYRNLLEYKNSLDMMNESFPKKLAGIDWGGMEMMYETEVVDETSELTVIEDVVNYSLPLMDKVMQEGKTIYEFFENNIEFKTVGIEPLYKKEGYILVRMNKEVTAYRYKVTLFNRHKRMLSLDKVGTYISSLSNNVEKIKMKLAKKYDMPNPATFFVDIDFDSPMKETILPIIKRKFVSDINVH